MPAHKHAENMALYAQDALETDKPWERWEVFCFDSDFNHHVWIQATSPICWMDTDYRRKPKTSHERFIDWWESGVAGGDAFRAAREAWQEAERQAKESA